MILLNNVDLPTFVRQIRPIFMGKYVDEESYDFRKHNDNFSEARWYEKIRRSQNIRTNYMDLLDHKENFWTALDWKEFVSIV